MSIAANPRQLVIRFLFIGIALVILVRLFILQVFEDQYKIMANDIAIYRKVVYPPRGVIYDRKGKVMLYNQVVYDLLVTPNNVSKNLDTTSLCDVLGIDKPTFEKLLTRIRIKNGPMRKGAIIEELSPAQTARFHENLYMFPGFELSERHIRTYPNTSSAIMLGYIGEVSPAMLKKPRYSTYQQGDYAGIAGLENSYEEVLRGQRGVYFLERDNFNRPTEPYKRGTLDTPAIAGRSLELYLDAELQAYAEKLFVNKIGSAVAIDPKTGGILAMVSAPTYDPNLLKGRERSKNYSKLYSDATHPLYNRATQASYQPGSTMKPMTALIALDVGAITPSFGYPCGGGYFQCGRGIACTHSGGGHAANLRLAIAHSCNAYFVHCFRLIADSKKFGNVKVGTQVWSQYCREFGFGHKTGVDIPYEGTGLVPDSNLYNKMYRGVWNSCTNLFVGMGQGEIAVTPLQMANAMAFIANKGYYYTPHFVRAIGGNPNDTILKKYQVKHKVTHIPDTTFSIVALGMQDVVEHGTGRVAQLPGLEICAKTGTVENKAVVNGQAMKMKDHSVFVAFAPRTNPKIAIAVIVENAGFGATWAGPIASLMMEKYLFGHIDSSRRPLEDRMLGANLINPYIDDIDSANKRKDREREMIRIAKQRYEDSIIHRRDSIYINRWLRKTYLEANDRKSR
ncbi:penicillin-binding protein 2 [Polluticoccus soli]|uniref:penicillin-binding protein 2 n=1 Tax=Polluticoccus soli TaxID=3034150 RepID=UPI0023E31BED|nr:penicillin-binding protein 2 [Flavipsychrobacter sp. JY13-12]